MADTIIGLNEVRKTFSSDFLRRRRTVLQGISLEVHRGETFAFKVPGKSGPTWRYEFHPVDGGTRVIESVRQAAPSPAIISFIQRRNGVTDRSAHLADGMRTTLANLSAAI